MYRIVVVLLVSLLWLSVRLNGQEVLVSATNEPLNKVLTHLIDDYNASISFNDKALSVYKITLSGKYPSAEKAITALLTHLPLQYELQGDVLVIFPAKVPTREKRKWLISGRVSEQGTGELLPYSHVMINGVGMVTDLTGSFSYASETDSTFKVQVSYLGYFKFDSLVVGNARISVSLMPSSIGLSEVVIENKAVERAGQYGQKPGLIKLNHRIAGFLPGYGDNSVFNLLRLQPGILASGEQTNELIIWGSYEGQSKVVFDGMTIYGLKNFNDNISSFNPLMAKDIEINKGGYDVTLGDRVGGIVNVAGKLGNIRQASFEFVVNNMTINSLVEIPIAKKGSLILSFRHTYYDLFNPEDLNFLVNRNTDADSANDLDLTIRPDYKFRDINLKYSTRMGKNDDLFYVSFYAGSDNFGYHIDETYAHYQLLKETKEENSQSGAAIFYGKQWSERARTNFTVSYSALRSQFTNNLQLIFPQISQVNQVADKHTDNQLTEFSTKADNIFRINSTQSLETGVEIISNRVELKEDTFAVNYLNMQNNSPRLNLYAQDVISLGSWAILKPGLRLTYAHLPHKIFADPRISLSVKASEKWKINLAWGIYHQYIARSSVLDAGGNYKYLWAVCDSLKVPVLSAQHYVVGTSFHASGFTASLDAYYKNVNGLTRYIQSYVFHVQDVFTGKGRSYGVDVVLKHEFRQHAFWIAYSLSRTEELFTYFLDQQYRRAPQDQTHEIKLAGSLNFDPFFFSADYVYGSGFPDYLYERQVAAGASSVPTNYSRLDVSAVYKFLNRRLKGEVGISVLNVLNRENFKLENFEHIPAGQTSGINIYAEAIPFTPTLFLKLYL